MQEIYLERPKLVVVNAWNNASRLLGREQTRQFRNPMTTIFVRQEGDGIFARTLPSTVHRVRAGWHYRTAETKLPRPDPNDANQLHVPMEIPVVLREWQADINSLGASFPLHRQQIRPTNELITDRDQLREATPFGRVTSGLNQELFEHMADAELALITGSLAEFDSIRDSVDTYGRTDDEKATYMDLARKIHNRSNWLLRLRGPHAEEPLSFQTSSGKITLESEGGAAPENLSIRVELAEEFTYDEELRKVVPIEIYYVNRALGTIQLITGRDVYDDKVKHKELDPPKPNFVSMAGIEKSGTLLRRLYWLNGSSMIPPEQE